MGRNKDGSLTGEDLANYQAAWNQQNGANYDYSRAMAAGQPAGSIQVLNAPPGWSSSTYNPQLAAATGGKVVNPTQAAAQSVSYGTPSYGATASSGGLPSLGGGASGSGGGGLSVTGAGGSNTAAPNADISAFQQMYKDRYTQLQNANKPNDALTKRMQDLTGGQIQDASAGAQQQLSENLARRGVAGGGVENDLRGRVAESAQRAGAAAKANIAIGRAGQEEQANLARDQQLNSLLLGGTGVAGMNAQLQLANQELALRQYQIEQQAALASRSQASNDFVSLLGLFR